MVSLGNKCATKSERGLNGTRFKFMAIKTTGSVGEKATVGEQIKTIGKQMSLLHACIKMFVYNGGCSYQECVCIKLCKVTAHYASKHKKYFD